MFPTIRAVRERSTRYGILTIVTGLVLLLGLRIFASPIGRQIMGRSRVTVVEFLLIPVFLLVVVIGILLFLWTPEENP